MPSLALSSCPWPNSRWRQYLQAGSHDVNLADYNLGSWTGIDAFDLLQEEGCDIPFILLTAALGLNFSSGHLLTADPRGVSAFGIWPAIPFSRAQRKVRSVAKRKSLRNRGALRGLTAPYACFRSRGSLGTYFRLVSARTREAQSSASASPIDLSDSGVSKESLCELALAVSAV